MMHEGPPVWHDSADICALSGAGRHLGHVVRSGSCWIAFDGTHLNEAETGFRVLGTFRSVWQAKESVERVSDYFTAARGAGTGHIC